MSIARVLLVALLVGFGPHVEAGDKNYGPGVSDSEITIGQTMPYSGSASALGVAGAAEVAYFRKINADGGVKGRKITLISLDDGYSPAKTVEQTRRLVESDNVLAIFQSIGTASNTAIQKYLNAKGVPHLFVGSGATRFDDPKNFPWTTGKGSNGPLRPAILSARLARSRSRAMERSRSSWHARFRRFRSRPTPSTFAMCASRASC